MDEVKNEIKATKKNVTSYNSMEFLIKQLESHFNRYEFEKLESYDSNFFKNLNILIKNLPKYSDNKKKMKKVRFDYSIYYHGEDLKYFIKYIDKSNSIRLALAIIFNTCKLSEQEIEYLFDQQKCVDWVSEYCNLRTFDLGPSKKLVKTKKN